jgi:hypothetical protein
MPAPACSVSCRRHCRLGVVHAPLWVVVLQEVEDGAQGAHVQAVQAQVWRQTQTLSRPFTACPFCADSNSSQGQAGMALSPYA